MIKQQESICAVVTTIHGVTPAIQQLLDWGVTTVLVADRKTPSVEEREGLIVLSVDRQHELFPELASSVPYDHYGRKNLGYLWAIGAGFTWIYDTDDDNYSYEPPRRPLSPSHWLESDRGFVNPYPLFGQPDLWPRGFPLEEIRQDHHLTPHATGNRVLVWQGVVDDDPDVDAIYRLCMGKTVRFQREGCLALCPQTFAPFNSQNTLWHRDAAAAMYLPCTVSFRATDIWRGYLAQAHLWALGGTLGWTGATARQERNDHDLMKDFRDELPCYQHAAEIADIARASRGQLTDAYRLMVQRNHCDPHEEHLWGLWTSELHLCSNAIAMS